MRKILLIFFAIFAFANEEAKTQKSLENNAELEKKLNKKLDELAKDIINGEENSKIVDRQINELKAQVKELETSAKKANSSLNALINQNEGLIKEQQKIEDNMLKIITEEFAYDLIVPRNYAESEESIMANEAIKIISKSSQQEVNKLVKDYTKTINQIKTQNDKISAIKFDLSEFKNKQEKLLALQNKQRKDLAQLKKDKQSYQKQLQDLQIQQKELRATLEKLAIIAKQEEQKRQESKKQEEQKLASKEAKTKNTKVRQVGSSYQMSSVKKYTGAKTIAPLDSFTLKQAFGDYTDPIYKIKIFNESVVLRSKTNDAVVKTVLDGKVVFAKDTGLLERVVIVEHSGGIHTIYAHLSKIAPTIKVGSRIKKGYVIGRVDKDLTFEVTQQNHHINPMELIANK